MSEAEQFRDYAKEAMWAALECTDEIEKHNLMDLGRTWMSAAIVSGRMAGSAASSETDA